jgi:hypothetical protein
MESDSLSQQKAQLDKAEREHLEDIVEKLRSRVEDNVRFQLTQKGLDDEPENRDSLDEDIEQLVEAIDIEGVDGHTWEEAFEKYIAGVGYTIVNRLAALRCMEVREFIDEEVTVFKETGLTPAAETLVHEEFLLEDEAIIAAYHNTCDELADEMEILFNRSSTYSLIDPDDDTFEELCGMLDEIPDEVWRADDVLGWVYEYYNRPVVEALDAKNTLEPEDVGPANQFYTPHWVVRMLADNSLGKLYLEATGQEGAIPDPETLSPAQRKNRLVTPEDASSVPELCTYLIPDEEPGTAPDFDHPRELRVIDPACGSGHFLLYAFDILERIWWTETDLDRDEIPAKILEHNLYGIDIDLRSCQLSAFNLYLKARTRAEEEGGQFEMPNVGIVCADARVAEIEEGTEVLDEITGEGTDLREAIDDLIETFQQTEALGSLLDVSGTLEEAFDSSKTQTELTDYNEGAHQSLHSFLKALRRAVEERTSDSFGEQNLKSFLNLLVVLTQEYDTALMNPPYGSRGRMPNDVTEYIEENYHYTPEYYINFFEACDNLCRSSGRVGMLVPRSFMFKRRFLNFRSDFIGSRGSFDFLAEFGLGILDKATVRTVGTIVRSGQATEQVGEFIRLSDLDPAEKEPAFLNSAFTSKHGEIRRTYQVPVSEFDKVPWSPLSYWTPTQIRELHENEEKLDPDVADIEGKAIATAAKGMDTGDNDRFIQRLWESDGNPDFIPYAKGGSDAWIMPEVTRTLNWSDDGSELERFSGSNLKNSDKYGLEGLTWTYAKETGRRFGYFPPGGAFDGKGSMLFPSEENPWTLMTALNSSLYHSLFLSLTPERDWQVGDVGRIPWLSQLASDGDLREACRRQYSLWLENARSDPKSPYYLGPELLPNEAEFYYDHPHNESVSYENIRKSHNIDYSQPLTDIVENIVRDRADRHTAIEEAAEQIDAQIYDTVGISEGTQEQLEQEIEIRSSSPSNDDTPTADEKLPEMVKDMIHHVVLETVSDSSVGTVPVTPIADEPTLYERIVNELSDIFGDFSEERLADIDRILGSRTSEEIPYPNLRAWVEEDLFDYHVQKFDRVPILWRFTTERLVSDPQGEGFGCLIDYHQLDEGLFDRLKNRYLDPRKNRLRERRSAANRRRSDDSLSTSEQAEAAEEYARCESGLEQIAVFEERLAELAQHEPRDWPQEHQERADEAAERVAEFRRRTKERLEIVDELAAMEDVDMAELFTGNFYEKVENHRDEWIGALDNLTTAFNAYAADTEQPVEAHLYDLLDYYTDDLLGSSHFASNGILYMTYYFDNFEQSDQARLDDADISRRQRLLSQLASDLDDYIELGESISEDCHEISSDVSSDWADRALSEITTAGYQPNHKHGVEINITPLSNAEIVPKTVDDEVL